MVILKYYIFQMERKKTMLNIEKQDSCKQIIRRIKFHIWIILFWSIALFQKYERDDIFPD